MYCIINCLLLIVILHAAIINVDVHGSTDDSIIVEKLQHLLDLASPDEFQRIKGLVLLREQGVNLMDVQHGSIRLYFWCLNKTSISVLKEWAQTGRLKTVIEELFELLTSSKMPVRLSYDLKQFDNAIHLCNKYGKCSGECC